MMRYFKLRIQIQRNEQADGRNELGTADESVNESLFTPFPLAKECCSFEKSSQ